MSPFPTREEKEELVLRIRSILRSRQLTMAAVSARSMSDCGRQPEFFIPHNFYYNLRSRTFSPSIYQVFALSKISRYCLEDWLRLFGFDPEEITRLQLSLPCPRSILLDTSVVDCRALVPSYRDRPAPEPTPSSAPLGTLLQFEETRQILSLARSQDASLYMKIGEQDAIAFPDLLPGSIVRIQPAFDPSCLPRAPGEISKRIFLIEHDSCLSCCALRLAENGRLVPAVSWDRYVEIDWAVQNLSSIRGVVDLEVRSLRGVVAPPSLFRLTGCWKPHPLISGPKVSRLLRSTRAQLNLSLRDASGIASRAAELTGNRDWFISPSSLSDYEALDTLPRHLPKLFALCAVYGLNLSSLLQAAGLKSENAGTEMIPGELAGRDWKIALSDEGHPILPNDGSFTSYLSSELGSLPFLLRRSLGTITGLVKPVLRDFFWVGGEPQINHPYLSGSLLVVVDRHKKMPRYSADRPLWQQPVYLVRMRDGRYVCGCGGLENGILILHSFANHLHSSSRLHNLKEAEVVGQIVASLRKLN